MMLKKRFLLLGGIITITLIGYGVYYFYSETITYKTQGTIVHNVNTELDKKSTTYLDGMKDPTKAEVDFSKVDTKKLGKYVGIIKYKGNEYKIEFHIMDTEKPVIKAGKKDFSFPLNKNLKEINAEINKHLKFSDNYDKEFKTIDVVKELPKKPSTQKYTISIKDKAGNESEKVEIKVTFTEPKEEEKEQENSNNSSTSNGNGTSNQKPQSSNGNNGYYGSNGGSSSGNTPSNGGGNSSNGNQGNGNIQKPKPTPQPPQVDYETDIQIPANALDGGVFDTWEAGDAWAMAQTREAGTNPNSPWSANGIRGSQYRDGKWRVWIEAGY